MGRFSTFRELTLPRLTVGKNDRIKRRLRKYFKISKMG